MLDALEPEYRCLFEFALSTGCRSGEKRGLKWGKIDSKTKTVKIDRQLDKQGNYATVKTGRSGERTIPLSDGLYASLAAHKLASNYSKPDDYVFVTKAGTPFCGPNVARILKRALIKAEIAEPYPTMHDFRHTFASAFIAARAGDAVQLSKLLGHANPLVTLSRYSHEFEAAERGDELQASLSKLWA